MATKNYSAIDFNLIPLINVIMETLGSAPGSPTEGRRYYDSALHKERYYNGSAWINLDNIPAAGSITDSQVSSSAAIAESKLALASDGSAGTATRRSLGTGSTQAAPGNASLSQFTAPTAAWGFGSQRLTNVADPTSAQDAATKNYVDNARAGIAGIKDPVKVATNVNTSITAVPATIDGVTMASGDRFLLFGQTTTTQNGIYVYTSSGSAVSYASDSDGTGEIQDGTIVAVGQGTNAGYQIIQTATPSGAPGSWSQVWTVYSVGGQTYTAGTGLTLTGSTFALTVPVTIANGGTNATSASAARTSLGISGGQKYAANVAAMTAGTALNISHNLGTTDVAVDVFEISSGKTIQIEVTRVDSNTVSLTSANAVSANTLRIVVSG